MAGKSAAMQLDWADEIDSACTACGGNAVDWVQISDGTRRYACESCLRDMLRYDGPDSLADLPDTPNAVKCHDCGRLTLDGDTVAVNRCRDCTPEQLEKQLEQAREILYSDSGE